MMHPCALLPCAPSLHAARPALSATLRCRRSAEAGQPGCFAYVCSQPQPSWADDQAARVHRGGAGTSPPGTRCASGGATASSCGAPSSYGGPPYGGPCSCGSSPTHARPKSSSRRFTYGLSEFDDETVERMLAVDHADKRRVAQQRVLAGCSVRDARFSDVIRAARMQAVHQAMEERREMQRERGKGGARGGGGGGGGGSTTLMEAADEGTLDLLDELEKIGVYEPLINHHAATEAEGQKAEAMGADRSRRLASLPQLATVSIYEEEVCNLMSLQHDEPAA